MPGGPLPADRFDTWKADVGGAEEPSIVAGAEAASSIIIMACRLFAPAETERALSGKEGEEIAGRGSAKKSNECVDGGPM